MLQYCAFNYAIWGRTFSPVEGEEGNWWVCTTWTGVLMNIAGNTAGNYTLVRLCNVWIELLRRTDPRSSISGVLSINRNNNDNNYTLECYSIVLSTLLSGEGSFPLWSVRKELLGCTTWIGIVMSIAVVWKYNMDGCLDEHYYLQSYWTQWAEQKYVLRLKLLAASSLTNFIILQN
jgi:hypothetical protein